MPDDIGDIEMHVSGGGIPPKEKMPQKRIGGAIHLDVQGGVPILRSSREQDSSKTSEELSKKVQASYEKTEHPPFSETQGIEPEISSPASCSPSTVLPSVSSLLEKYSLRPFGEILFHSPKTDKLGKPPKIVLGYQSTLEEEQQDTETLKSVVDAHNLQFSDKISSVTTHNDDGYIEKLVVPVGSEICIRSDLHGDLASLMAELVLLQTAGKLDENFHCVGDFKLLFLGDNTDKGANDIEVLTLLLKLRMENPSSVFLLRGNHEDVRVNQKNSMQFNFFAENEPTMTACYTSFPLAVCIGSSEKHTKGSGEEQRQFVHFSHGLFSPAVPMADFLAGDKSSLTVPHCSVFPECAEDAAEKVKHAFATCRELFKDKQEIQGRKGYSETEILSESPEGKAQEDHLVEGKRFHLSPHTVSLLLETTGTQAKVKMVVRGHQHESAQFFKRTKKGRRVFLKTLAVGSASGPMAKFQQSEQALLCTVAPKVHDWTQRPIVMRKNSSTLLPVFVLSEERQPLAPLAPQDAPTAQMLDSKT